MPCFNASEITLGQVPIDADQQPDSVEREINRVIESGHHQLILSGPSGSGKGTQASKLSRRFGVVIVAPGELLRKAIYDSTELGLKAKAYMDGGKLVPDDLVIQLVQDKLNTPECRLGGWVLDGYPRTVGQAKALTDAGIIAEHCFALSAPEDTLIERCIHRRVDPVTGETYHLKTNPPPEDDEIRERLVKRHDDEEKTIQTRLAQFSENAQAISRVFSDITHGINAEQEPAKIFKDIVKILEADSPLFDAGLNKDRPSTSGVVHVQTVELGEDKPVAFKQMTLPGDPVAQLRIIQVNDVYELENLAHLANLIKEYRTENTVTVMPGDFLAPSPLSSLDGGAAMIEIMNDTPIDYVCFGNHEWDVGMVSLQAAIKNFRGKWINSNMKDFSTDKIMPAYEILQVRCCCSSSACGKLCAGGGRRSHSQGCFVGVANRRP